MVRRLKFAMATAAAAVTLAFSLPASAATYNLGTLSEGTPVVVAGILDSTLYGNSSDLITFSLSGVDDLGTSLTAVPPINVGLLQFGLSTVNAQLYSGMSGSGTFIGSLTGLESKTFDNLAAGSYYITVDGTALNPTLGGAYGLGLLATSAAPVPGPAALLPALLGAGAIAWRRRRSRGKGQAAVPAMA